MGRRNYILVLGMICLIFLLVECEKTSDNGYVDKNITYVKTVIGGCNGLNFPQLKSGIDESADTVVFTIENDTLDIFIGLNYICCAPFTSNAIISNDSIIMTLNDTCSNPYQNCYCRCICYYIWDYLFIDFDEKEYFFKIILIDPREENPVIVNEGKIDLSTDN